MRVSQRSIDVQLAQTEIRNMILRESMDRGLTSIELLQALTETQQGVLKYMLRAERHPDDPDKPADVD